MGSVEAKGGPKIRQDTIVGEKGDSKPRRNLELASGQDHSATTIEKKLSTEEDRARRRFFLYPEPQRGETGRNRSRRRPRGGRGTNRAADLTSAQARKVKQWSAHKNGDGKFRARQEGTQAY